MASVLSSISDSFLEDGGDDWEHRKAPLCGRTHETLQILNAYHRVTSNNHLSEVVIIHGESGCGKTALVEILRETACESNGYYVAGKYFQNAGIQEPYSAVMAAFSDLCDLVSQSDDFEKRRLGVQKELGDNGWLLSKTISHLSPFLKGSVEEEVDIKNEVALAKFTIACKSFLHAMTCPEHPIVLVLDDIQWMDEGSRQLLEIFLTDTELTNVLLVLIYRDEEQEAALDLLDSCPSSSSLPRSQIHVDGLDADGIYQIVTSHLNIQPSENALKLSNLVYQRTLGNAFHVLGFLDFIQQENLLTLESESPTIWKFDVEEIKQETMLVDNIADMLLRKIQRLPDEVNETLKIASLLGFRFEKDIIAHVLWSSCIRKVSNAEESLEDNFTSASVSASLEIAVQNRFIERTIEGYQFCHDKFQSLFQSMVDESAEPRIYKLIGEKLLDDESPKARYHAAIHLNRSVGLLIDDGRNLADLARINLEASVYCKHLSFFFEATQLLKSGLDFVPESEKWGEHYDLTLQISSQLAKMMLCIGNYDGCIDMCQGVRDHGKTINDKLDCFTIHVEALASQSKIEESVSFGLATSKELGVQVPSKVSVFQLLYKMAQINRLLRGKSDADILNGLIMTDRSKSTTVRMLTIVSSSYLVLKKDKEGAYCSLLALELSLREGLSPHSVLAFATFAAIQMGLGKHEKALRYGELGMRIKGQHNRAGADSVIIVASLISHWSTPLMDIAETLHKSAKLCFASGDISPAISGVVWVHTCAGENLVDLERLYSSYHDTIRDLHQNDSTLLWLLPAYQYVLNLQSKSARTWRNLTELTGDIMKESEYINRAVQSGEETLWSILWTFKFQLEFHFGYHSAAEATFENLKSYIFKSAMSYHFHGVMIVGFLGSLNFYERSHEQPRRWQYLRKARYYKRYLNKLKVSTRPNLIPLLAILEAEELSIKTKTTPEALEHSFNTAIQANITANFVHMEALANERAGFAFGRRSDEQRAKLFFEKAIDLYRDDYGATNKAEWLRERSQQILSRLNNDLTGETTRGSEFVVDTIRIGGASAKADDV